MMIMLKAHLTIASNVISLLLTAIGSLLYVRRTNASIGDSIVHDAQRKLQQDIFCCNCMCTDCVIINPPSFSAHFPASSPSALLMPSSSREENIIAILSEYNMLDASLLRDLTSPHGQALDWIVNKDGLQRETSDAFLLLQRYVLALFYFSTTQQQPWLSCNAPTTFKESSSSDCTYQLAVEYSPDLVYEDTPSTRWLSSTPECSWAGIDCRGGDFVRSLDLNGQEIRGPLIGEVGSLLFDMDTFDLAFNNLMGTLPMEFGNSLQYLDLNENLLTGTIPNEWYDRVGTTWLSLSNNLLYGPITPEISRGSHHRVGLLLYNNFLFGTIPTEMGLLSELHFLYLNDNILDGTIPSELGDMDSLEELFLNDNFISGTLSEELSQLDMLQYLAVRFNSISGTIPWFTTGFESLEYLHVGDNRLTGTISPWVAELSSLTNLYVNDNLLSGTIPSELGHLTRLENLWLQGNAFTGSVPICGLEQLIADCGASAFKPEAIACSCCTICCEHGKTCTKQM